MRKIFKNIFFSLTVLFFYSSSFAAFNVGEVVEIPRTNGGKSFALVKDRLGCFPFVGCLIIVFWKENGNSFKKIVPISKVGQVSHFFTDMNEKEKSAAASVKIDLIIEEKLLAPIPSNDKQSKNAYKKLQTVIYLNRNNLQKVQQYPQLIKIASSLPSQDERTYWTKYYTRMAQNVFTRKSNPNIEDSNLVFDPNPILKKMARNDWISQKINNGKQKRVRFNPIDEIREIPARSAVRAN